MFYDLSEETTRVRMLQTMLRYLAGATGEEELSVNITGYFDELTESAVKRFQEKNGLKITGIADYDTWNEIKRQYDIENKLRERVVIYPLPDRFDYSTTYAERSDTVLILQILLNALKESYPFGTVPMTGVYGSQTSDAVKIFQIKNQLNDTGIADKTTWQRISEEYNLMRNM